MYECDDASVSSNSETLGLGVDGEISLNEVESAIRSLKCAKSDEADRVAT